mgnify:CR=1 FL=1
MKRFRQKSLLLACLILLIGCSEPDPIRIGFIAGLEGRASDLGIASRNAVQMAVDEVNAAGGINGRKVELVIRDDKRSTEGGAEAARDGEVLLQPPFGPGRHRTFALRPLSGRPDAPRQSSRLKRCVLTRRQDSFQLSLTLYNSH